MATYRAPDAAQPGYVDCVDGLRAAAALVVVVFHLFANAGDPSLFDIGPLRALAEGGFVGFEWFFVISGFVLFLPMVRRGSVGSVKAYFARRTARIVPLYYVTLVALLVLWPFFEHPAGAYEEFPLRSVDGLYAFGLHLGFLHDVFLGQSPAGINALWSNPWTDGFAVNGVVWTLTLEAIFYVLLPLIAKPFLRRPLLWVIGGVGGAFLFRYGLNHLEDITDFFGFHFEPATYVHLQIGLGTSFPWYMSHFALGMGAAYLAVKMERDPGKLRWLRTSWLPLLAGAAAVLYTWWYIGHAFLITRSNPANPYQSDYFTYGAEIAVAAAFAFFLLATVVGPPWGRRIWTMRLTRWTGDLSYGIYLWHLMVLEFVIGTLGVAALPVTMGTNTRFLEFLVIVLPITLVLATLSRRFLELPGIRWGRKWSQRYSSEPPLPPPAEPLELEEAAAP
jgi:peptidoglycan/LPS O-acetylase OafA/YrhL